MMINYQFILIFFSNYNLVMINKTYFATNYDYDFNFTGIESRHLLLINSHSVDQSYIYI